MAFPTSPTNGQQANINGITYTYSSAATAWTVSTSVSNTFVSINVSDNVNSGNVLATGVISATGNVSGSNLVVTGNIVDTGALTIVTGSNGNITLSPNGTGIVAATGAISTTGNISANNATFTSNQTLSYGTANGVVYLNSNKVATSGTALVFDGTNLGIGAAPNLGPGAPYNVLNIGTQGGGGIISAGTDTYLTNNLYISGNNYFAWTGGSAYGSYYNQTGGNHSWQTSTAAGTGGNVATLNTLMKLNTNGALALFGGVSATGVGITFPATQSASADANTLDDYEEGTWTPEFKGTGSNPTVTYTKQVGRYVKIGRMFYWGVAMVVNTTSGGSGILYIDAPVPILSTGSNTWGGTVTWNGTGTFTGQNPTNLACINGSTAMYLHTNSTTMASSDVTVSQLANGSNIEAFGMFETG